MQIPAPVAVETTITTPAPEVTSDAETLALPGLPGATENENVPSPVEEEVERTTVDPYVSAAEGATSGETALAEPAPPIIPTEHARGVTSSPSKGFGGLSQVIPIPTVSEGSGITVEDKPDNPVATPKAKAKSVSTRKPKAKEDTKETPEQKEEREKAERAADELVQQEQEEKKRQAAKDAKSKKAAAENTEKAREAAAQQRKAKEQTAEGEQTIAQKRRIKAATPDDDPEDRPPPDDDDQPWEIYHYRPHIEVTPTWNYEEEDRGVKHYDLESAYNLDLRGTRVPFQHGQATTVSESVKFLQQGNRRVRDIRAEQIERLVAARPIVPSGPHPCVLKGGFLLMRVSIPYHKNGHLMLGTFPGTQPRKHTVTKIHQVPTLGLTMEVDKPTKKPDFLTHLAIHSAGAAIGYEVKNNSIRAENKSDWFTVLRAARVFLKELSTAQYTNTGATEVAKSGFLYYPSELMGIIDEANKGRWVHLISLTLQVSKTQWAAMRALPFYV